MLIEPKVFRDPRGFFLESYRRDLLAKGGITTDFIQDNHSMSQANTIRGMHFQSTPGQAKLIRCARGKIWDVAVDIRPDSKTFGKWQGIELDAENHHQLFIPVGFAHGFCALSDQVEVLYKISTPYDPETETGFAYNDPEVGIAWPVAEALVSDRDKNAQSFADYKKSIGL